MMKLAPVYRQFSNHSQVSQVVVHTGQHYDHNMIGAFLAEFSLPAPDYDLGVGSSGHLAQIGSILIELAIVFKAEKPDIVFVYGDTNSTAAGAIAAAKSNIKVAHVEAGLREFDKAIPEEVNKLLTDAVTDLFFCPTETAVSNLSQSGVTKGVHHSGDVVLDLLHSNAHDLGDRPVDEPYYFFTCHRAANTESRENMSAILLAMMELEHQVVFPMHPRTRNAITGHGLGALLNESKIKVIDPIGFWEAQRYIKHAECVITDSGGIVREAYFHQSPCVIVDNQIEWIEVVNEGWAVVSGADKDRIVANVVHFDKPLTRGGALGDGSAAEQIVQATLKYFQE